MANIKIKIKDEDMPRTITAYTAVYGYSPTITDPVTGAEKTNPETALLFTERKIREYISAVVAGYEASKAADAARLAALSTPILVEPG